MATKKAPAKKAAKKENPMLLVLEGASYLTKDEKQRLGKQLKVGKDDVIPSLDCFNIAKHKLPPFVPVGGTVHESVYDEKKNKWVFTTEEEQLCDILESLTYAVLNGKLNSRAWVYNVFHTKENWKFFLQELSEYENYYRIRDPWWWALAKLAEHEDVEETFSTAEEMAEALDEHARETGQTALLT